MSCSKQFSTTDRLGLDLHKVLSSAKLQVYQNKHNEIVNKDIEYERTKNKTLGYSS